jgi:iron complex transport system ATP-binding protein
MARREQNCEREQIADTSSDTDPEMAGSSFSGQNLTLSYPSSDEPVIEDASIDVPLGAVTVLVGPNGSGKSTLLNGLSDQHTPDEGTVLLDGSEIHSMGHKALARKLGLLSQEHAVPDSTTVEQLVTHGRYPYGTMLGSLTEADYQAINRAIELAGIERLRDRDLGSLSGGQRQLVWIAMALAQNTDVLLLDEPTTFLDLYHQLEVLELIERLRNQREVTIIAVLHDIEQAARIADHVVILKNGTIQTRGDPETVFTEQLLADVFDVEATVEVTDHGPRITPIAPI